MDESQRPDFKYDAEQLASDVHVTDVTAMMMVRIDLKESDHLQSSRTNNTGQEVNDRNHVEERISRKPATVSAEEQFQQDLAKAQAISRKETPGCLGAEEVIRLGRETAARMGISCNKPNLPLENSCFIPMDGDCIFSCCCHANDPSLRGERLKNGAWELRVRAVGTVLEKMKYFTEEQWSLLQAVVTGNDQETLSKEEIMEAVASYMESGKFSCNVGDLVLQFAASYLQQPILVIRIKDCQVINSSWVEPVEMFGGDSQSQRDPIVVVWQLQHYETLLLDDEAKAVAKTKFHHWRISRRVGISQGENLDANFNPPCSSTPTVETETESPQQGTEQGVESSLGQVKSFLTITTLSNSKLFKTLNSKMYPTRLKILVIKDNLQASANERSGMQRCNCGYAGPIASHLRSNPHCLQGIREEMYIGPETTDEVLIIQTTLILQGCPAFGCEGGNHEEIPEKCFTWWKENGWLLMQWDGSTEDLNSSLIKQKCRGYVRNLTEEFEESQQKRISRNTQISSTAVVSQLDPSQRHSQIFEEAHTCLCNYNGLLSDHLRNSKQCVDNLRRQPQLQMTVPKDEDFIVKATVILRGCPAPGCPGGAHQQIPDSCLFWWREVGWKVMRWKGSGENARAADIKTKQSKFRRNFLHRNMQSHGSIHTEDNDFNQQSHQAENINLESQREEGCCKFCQHQESVVHHLHHSKPCLRGYIKEHLPQRARSYIGKSDLAIFDLSLLLSICANSACMGSIHQEGVTRHLQGECLQFYQKEGERLFQWDRLLDKTSVYERLKKRKSWLKTMLRDKSGYQEDIANVLRNECCRCKMRGPLLDESEHKMCAAGINQMTGRLLWECAKCKNGDERHGEMVLHAIERAAELGAPIESDDSMKIILVEDKEHHQRVVFVPASIVPDYDVPNIDDRELNPLHTTVLVPRNPEALDQIGDEASERANLAKESLERVAEYFGRRFLVGSVTECVSVFYRLKIAQIRVERLSMLSILTKTSKGKVKSRNPNHASCKERRPHFETTKKFCLTNTCSWSPAAQERRSQESAARACVNGRVKIKLDMTILKELATDSPHLRDIISETLLLHGPPLISLAPLVLNYLKAKVRLLVKHIFSQTFKDWDLDLIFAEKEWTVRLVGFLYCEEFEELNSKIASDIVSEEEINKEVMTHPHLLPTTTTSKKELLDIYLMTEEQAEVDFH